MQRRFKGFKGKAFRRILHAECSTKGIPAQAFSSFNFPFSILPWAVSANASNEMPMINDWLENGACAQLERLKYLTPVSIALKVTSNHLSWLLYIPTTTIIAHTTNWTSSTLSSRTDFYFTQIWSFAGIPLRILFILVPPSHWVYDGFAERLLWRSATQYRLSNYHCSACCFYC